MWARLIPVWERLEAFLRIDATLGAEVRTRSRIIYLAGLLFVAIQLANMVSMFHLYGTWDHQHTIAMGACVVLLLVTACLRYTKSPLFFGIVYAILPIAAISYSAMAGSSLIHAQGIDTPLLPLLVGAIALLAYTGTRLTSLAYTCASILMLVWLYRYSVGFGVTQAEQMVLYQRALQGGFALVLVAVVTSVVSHQIYRNLNALEAMVERAQTAEQDRAKLLNTVSHEIRTPLNGIIAMSDLLTYSDLSPRDKDSAALILRSAENLLELLDETLERASHENGPIPTGPVAREPFAPAQLIEDVCALFKASADAKALWIGAALPDGLPTSVLGDSGRLRQVLSNLVGNAVKFTQTGGVRLGITAGAVQPDGIDLLFYVQDTGAGIAQDDQERIFQSFAQSASSQTTSVKGTGLGLPICREMVEEMGGELQVSSALGQGSTFYFTLRLPLNAQAPEAAQDPEATSRPEATQAA